MRTLIVLLVLIWAAPVAAQKNTSITSTGLLPVQHVRTAQQQADAMAASAAMVPRDANGAPSPTGKVVGLGLGMSTGRSYHGVTRSYLTNVPEWKNQIQPSYKFVAAAQSGKTAKYWADATHYVWTYAVSSTEARGYTALQVQWIHFYLTEGTPSVNGVMTAAQVLQATNAALQHFPNVQMITFTTTQWTGQTTSPLLPNSSVHSDDALLSSLQGFLPNGVYLDYVSGYADGDIPNASTASPRYPLGLTWLTADSADDGIHDSPSGALKMAESVFDRMTHDPVYRFMHTNQIADPIPPPDPVTVGLPGATITKSLNLCQVSATPPNVAGPLVMNVPALWCAGF